MNRIVLILFVFCASPAFAEEVAEAPTAETVEPRVLHRPVAAARTGRPLRIEVQVTGDWRVEALRLSTRVLPDLEWRVHAFRRSGADTYEVEVPADAIRGPGLAYAIHSSGRDGAERAHFASRAEPHVVKVVGESKAEVQARELRRYRGKRSSAQVRSEFTAYGRRPEGPGGEASDRYSDQYWRVDAEYVYRPLGIVHDFRFGAGVMRSSWPEVDGEATQDADPGGLNYGKAELNLEFHRWFSMGARLILAAGSERFVAGGAGIVRVGDMAGTHFAGELEGIMDVGVRSDLRLHWATVPRVPMALGIEFTQWPASDDSALGANLSYDLGWWITDGFLVGARVGLASRTDSIDQGFQAGLRTAIEF